MELNEPGRDTELKTGSSRTLPGRDEQGCVT